MHIDLEQAWPGYEMRIPSKEPWNTNTINQLLQEITPEELDNFANNLVQIQPGDSVVEMKAPDEAVKYFVLANRYLERAKELSNQAEKLAEQFLADLENAQFQTVEEIKIEEDAYWNRLNEEIRPYLILAQECEAKSNTLSNISWAICYDAVGRCMDKNYQLAYRRGAQLVEYKVDKMSQLVVVQNVRFPQTPLPTDEELANLIQAAKLKKSKIF
jgi:hypothetical protein